MPSRREGCADAELCLVGRFFGGMQGKGYPAIVALVPFCAVDLCAVAVAATASRI